MSHDTYGTSSMRVSQMQMQMKGEGQVVLREERHPVLLLIHFFTSLTNLLRFEIQDGCDEQSNSYL